MKTISLFRNNKNNCVEFKIGVFRLINELHRKKVDNLLLLPAQECKLIYFLNIFLKDLTLSSLFQVKMLN